MQLYIRNGRVVTETHEFEGGLLVESGRVAGLVEGNPDHAADEVIDAQGLLILPGLVDAHVHFSEPGRGHWEGFRTGSMAAAAGGVTTIAEMPLNASPPTIDEDALALKRIAARQSIVDYALWGGLVADNRAHLDGLQAGGVAGFKAFMCASSTDFPRVNDSVMRGGMEQIAAFGSFLAVHAEDEDITGRLTADLRNAGRTDRLAWGETRPVDAELTAIEAAISMARLTGARLHIVHISSAEGVDLVTAAKRSGLAVTAETCPHYLFFCEDDLVRIGPEAKCAPPLRSSARVEALWDRVLQGEIDVIASDHSPCLMAEKTAGDGDIFRAWGGISGLQSTLPAMLTAGRPRGLKLTDLVRMTTGNPSRLFGFHPRKGALAIGADADIVIVDPDAVFVLQAKDLYYRNQHSAYVGSAMRGKVKKTIRRGITIFNDGAISKNAGVGEFLAGAGSYQSIRAHAV
ncbi:allantoinase [Devosia pacifica]|uniref:Allantoinase n=1 Tax=Devosia pacifica TaxID=1335967 RepID=A0A918VUP7_9HYPH|nr:allantoinase AllB [Devosia pacifica]GHA24927.1 allantoinase [Devosia pacifica]